MITINLACMSRVDHSKLHTPATGLDRDHLKEYQDDYYQRNKERISLRNKAKCLYHPQHSSSS